MNPKGSQKAEINSDFSLDLAFHKKAGSFSFTVFFSRYKRLLNINHFERGCSK